MQLAVAVMAAFAVSLTIILYMRPFSGGVAGNKNGCLIVSAEVLPAYHRLSIMVEDTVSKAIVLQHMQVHGRRSCRE